MSRFSLVLLLTACNATTATVKDIEHDDDITSPTTILGDDDDDDDDVTTTPYETPDPTWFLSGTLEVPADAEVPAGDVTVVLIEMDGDYQFGEVFRQVNVGPISAGESVDYEIGLADEAGDQWYWSDPYEPGMELALFALGAYIDEDGDGKATEADTYVSAGLDPFIASIRGVMGTDAGNDGALLGWNHVRYEVVTPFSGDLGGVDISANLLAMNPSSPLACEVIPMLDQGGPGQRRVDLWSFLGMYGGAADPTLISVPVPTDRTNYVFDFPALPTPPDDHLTNDLGDGPMDGLEIAAYIALAYVDQNGDGQWSGNVYVEQPLASNDSLDPATGARTLMYLKATGWGAGYVAPWFGGLGWVLFEEDPNDPYGDIFPLDFSEGLILDDNF